MVDDRFPDSERSLWKGAVAGAIGGATGAFVMGLVQQGFSKMTERVGADELSEQTHRHERLQNDATSRVAHMVSRPVMRRGLRPREKKAGGMAVHFAFGAAMGALYGLMAELTPQVTAGFGTAFGTALFAGADELVLPAIGLSKPPREIPAPMHGLGFATHAIYGATTEGVRRLARGVLH